MNTEDSLANRHFLVVDDEGFIRTLVARFLKRSGAASVVEAADGSEAMAALASSEVTFDAVISDINMRPMNGIELLRAIRTGVDGLKRNTPVLLLTVHGEAEFVAEAMALDADAFVLKPVERKSLIDRIQRVLESVLPEPVAIAHRVALGSVKPNSILAQDICVSDTSTLLLGAPTVLTRMVLDRLADLQHIHDSYSHLVVIEPHS